MIEQPLMPTKGGAIQFKIQVQGKQLTALIDNQNFIAGAVKIKVYDLIGLGKKEGGHEYVLNSYPKRKKFLRSERRYLEEFCFIVKQTDQKWEQISKEIIYKINNREQQESLKLLIMYNPNSGGNSKKNLGNILQFIQRTNLEPQVFTTKHKNHALDHLKTIDANNYCGVAIVSGDGLVHEFVNSFCDLPVTHIPAGSGNAFAKNQTLRAGQLCKDEECIFLVVKNRPCKFNLMKYQLQSQEEPVYSFLSLQWAFMADIDLNSQFLRFLGGFRFDVYAVYRALISLKRYKGRLVYSTTQTKVPPLNVDLEDNPNFTTLEQTFLYTMFTNLPYISTRHIIAPLLEFNDECADMQIIKQDAGKIKLMSYLLCFESGGQFDMENKAAKPGMAFSHAKIKSFRLQPLDAQNPGVYCIDGERYESQPIQGSLSEKTFRAFV